IHLFRILCGEQLSIDPKVEFSDAPIVASHDWKNSGHDAFLVIGDVCLAWEEAFPHKLDLGEAWSRLTSLPFVFAGWCVRPDLRLTADEIAAFADARSNGEREAHLLADQAVRIPPLTSVTPESMFEYLTSAIRYRMGKREITGMELFRQKLIHHKILPPDTPPVRIAKP